MPEKNKLPSEKTNDFSETSTIDTEKIGSDTEKIEVNTEKIPEIIPEKTRYRGQRGPDKAPRRINPKSLGGSPKRSPHPVLPGTQLLPVSCVRRW